MGVIFDTSEIIAIEGKSHDIYRITEGREDEPFGISVITVAELLHGVERADTHTRKIKRQAFVEKVIEFFPVVGGARKEPNMAAVARCRQIGRAHV